MKHLLLCLGYLISFFAHAQNEEEEARKLRQKNKIQESSVYQFSILDSVLTGDSLLAEIKLYDYRGNAVKGVRYKMGKIFFQYISTFNEKGEMLSQTVYNEFNNRETIMVYEYDSNSNRIAYKQLDAKGNLLEHQRFSYGKDNRVQETYNRKPDSTFFISARFHYRPDGKYSRVIPFGHSGHLPYVWEFEYDSSGNMLKQYYSTDGLMYPLQEHYYDNKNRITKTDLYHQNGVYRHTIFYVYDEEGNMLEKTTMVRGLIKEKLKYFYKKYK